MLDREETSDLAACPATAKLKRLDLDMNYRGPEGIRAVAALGIPCRIEAQHDPAMYSDEMIWDDEYLTEGDFE